MVAYNLENCLGEDCEKREAKEMIAWTTFFSYVLVSILWGCTNPYIKHAQKSKEATASTREVKDSRSIVGNIKRLVQDYKLMLPFVGNQLGSVVFYFLLSTEPISVASPVCNSLSFLFTAITSYFVFNEMVKHPVLLLAGTVVIVLGTAVCLAD